jgi:hypothetical protein
MNSTSLARSAIECIVYIIILLFYHYFRYEHGFGGLSSHNFCVTQAMKDDLFHNWQIRYEVL